MCLSHGQVLGRAASYSQADVSHACNTSMQSCKVLDKWILHTVLHALVFLSWYLSFGTPCISSQVLQYLFSVVVTPVLVFPSWLLQSWCFLVGTPFLVFPIWYSAPCIPQLVLHSLSSVVSSLSIPFLIHVSRSQFSSPSVPQLVLQFLYYFVSTPVFVLPSWYSSPCIPQLVLQSWCSPHLSGEGNPVL